jgi:nucleoside-diphosphate-sugar epimerase
MLSEAVKGKDYVFHVGAIIDSLNWDALYKVNVEGTRNLLEVCAEVNPDLKKFIFVSSISAAGPAINNTPKKESEMCNPVSQYGKSKLLAEEAAAKFFTRLPIVIIRPTNVLGTRQRQLYSSLKLAKKRIIPLLGNGDKQTTICFVQDVVESLILAAENKHVRGKTFFVADQKPYSWREIMEFITQEFGYSFVIKIPFPLLMIVAFFSEIYSKLTGSLPLVTRQGVISARKNYWLQDISSIKEEFGFSPKINFEEGIRDIMNWYKKRNLL